MILKSLFGIRDVKSGVFENAPFQAHNVGEAMRMFGDLVNRPGTIVAEHPADFELFYLGTFDQVTGQLGELQEEKFVLASPQKVASGLSVMKPEGDPRQASLKLG